MPANLPPQYYEVEKKYRTAKTPQEKIEILETMFSIMPKHKGTDRLRAELRTRIARLYDEAEKRTGPASRGSQYLIKREGAGQVILIGVPNSGKSLLFNKLTGVEAKVADYPFTTKYPMPGMMRFENIQIQLIDMPPVTDRASHPWMRTLLRKADLLLMVIDATQDIVAQYNSVMEMLTGMRIKPGETGSSDIVLDDLSLQKNSLIVLNKCDLNIHWHDGVDTLRKNLPYRCNFVPFSSYAPEMIDSMKKETFRALNIIRVYTRAPGQQAGLTNPVILKAGSTIEDVAGSIHKDIRRKLKFARVWGSVKFPGQQVNKLYQPTDGDIIELVA